MKITATQVVMLCLNNSNEIPRNSRYFVVKLLFDVGRRSLKAVWAILSHFSFSGKSIRRAFIEIRPADVLKTLWHHIWAVFNGAFTPISTGHAFIPMRIRWILVTFVSINFSITLSFLSMFIHFCAVPSDNSRNISVGARIKRSTWEIIGLSLNFTCDGILSLSLHSISRHAYVRR